MIELDFTTRNQQPYSNIGTLVTTWSDGSESIGTFSLVGRNDILTAAHCVYDPDVGGWATGFEFYFGADYNSATGQFESWLAQPAYTRWSALAWTSQAFTDSDHQTMLQSEAQFDVALIGIDTAIGDQMGWLGLAPGYDGYQSALAVGYPEGSTGMMQDSVTVTSSSVYDLYESSAPSMGPGSSGGPLLVGDYVIGVKSTSDWWADLGSSSIYSALVDGLADNDSLLGGAGNETPPPPVITGTAGRDTLTGGSAAEELRGLGGNDLLKGGGGDDTLLGGSGNDTLDGGSGLDRMNGGSGSDRYLVRNRGDVVVESATASTGGSADTVFSYLGSYTLGTGIENGRVLSTGTASLKGNALDNVLYAGSGSNVLSGGSGIDTVSYALGVGSTGKGVRVSLAVSVEQSTGGSGVDTLTSVERLIGTAHADTLTGSRGNNVLTGGGGRDVLKGNGGNDVFDFNALSEMGLWSTTRDVIRDFAAGDRIDLSTLDANSGTKTNDAFSSSFVSSFTRPGQLKFANGVLFGNTDGDSAAEFSIALVGVEALSPAAIIL